jgi:hypothetical protein
MVLAVLLARPNSPPLHRTDPPLLLPAATPPPPTTLPSLWRRSCLPQPTLPPTKPNVPPRFTYPTGSTRHAEFLRRRRLGRDGVPVAAGRVVRGDHRVGGTSAGQKPETKSRNTLDNQGFGRTRHRQSRRPRESSEINACLTGDRAQAWCLLIHAGASLCLFRRTWPSRVE